MTRRSLSKNSLQDQIQASVKAILRNMHNGRAEGYLEWGIYKPEWATKETATQERRIYQDNIRIGT